MRCTAVLAAMVLGALVTASPAEAKRFRGTRTIGNASGQRAMPVSRAKSIAQRVVRRVFAVRPRTEIYACSRHSFAEAGCDFQFTSWFGNITCGNAVVRASSAQIVVR